ncbi:MAG: DUF4249 domain-containing protein [Saprospiraceae bacterium]
MEKYRLPALYVLVAMLLLANCVREIEFQQNDADQESLVVSGVFTDGNGPHIVRLSRPGNYNRQVFPAVSGASVRLSDDLGNVYQYQEINPPDLAPYYQLSQVQGKTGRSYTLEIDLPNGEQYRSHPQIMPEPFPLDSVEVHGQWYYANAATGVVVREPFAFAYARTKAPQQPKDHYLHWDSEATYLFNELSPKPYNFFDPYASQQCFVNNRVNDQLVAIADLSKYDPGGVVYENVGKRKIDQAFEKKIAFSVYQRSIGREAYAYWNKINKLLTASGTIFDTPPAAVAGNLENLTHSDRPALGFFEVGAADTVRVYTGNGQLGHDFLLQSVPYCQLDYTAGFPPVNHPECDDCLSGIKGATTQAPWWWQ